MSEKEKPCGAQPQGFKQFPRTATTPRRKVIQMSDTPIPASQDDSNSCVQLVDELLRKIAKIEAIKSQTKRLEKEVQAAEEKIRLIRKIGESSMPADKKVELVHRILAGGGAS